MLAFLASKRLLLSGELSFGVVALLLAAGLAFPAAAFELCFGGGLRLLRALHFRLPRSVLRFGGGLRLLRALPFRLPHSELCFGG